MTSKWAAGAMSLTVAYFAYHAFAGEQGLGKWTDMQSQLAEKQAILAELEAENTRAG
jgi:cell division protein FtsB